jgi:hypothetical protein
MRGHMNVKIIIIIIIIYFLDISSKNPQIIKFHENLSGGCGVAECSLRWSDMVTLHSHLVT